MCMCIDPERPARDDPIPRSYQCGSEMLYELMSVQCRISRTNNPKKWTILERTKHRQIERCMRDVMEIVGIFSITVHHNPCTGFSKERCVLLERMLRKFITHKLTPILGKSDWKISVDNLLEMIEWIVVYFLHQKEFTMCEPYEVEV